MKQIRLSYLSLLLALPAAGCGGGDTHYVAAFLTTDTANALAAARAAKRPAATQPVTAAAAGVAQAQGDAVVATPAEAQPQSGGAGPATSP